MWSLEAALDLTKLDVFLYYIPSKLLSNIDKNLFACIYKQNGKLLKKK